MKHQRRLLLRRFVQIGDRLWRPPSLLSEGFNILIWMASFTPLSYHLGSTSKISVFMMFIECPGSVTWMCLETSNKDELGRLCSMNWALNERSVSPNNPHMGCGKLDPWLGICPVCLWAWPKVDAAYWWVWNRPGCCILLGFFSAFQRIRGYTAWLPGNSS